MNLDQFLNQKLESLTLAHEQRLKNIADDYERKLSLMYSSVPCQYTNPFTFVNTSSYPQTITTGYPNANISRSCPTTEFTGFNQPVSRPSFNQSDSLDSFKSLEGLENELLTVENERLAHDLKVANETIEKLREQIYDLKRPRLHMKEDRPKRQEFKVPDNLKNEASKLVKNLFAGLTQGSPSQDLIQGLFGINPQPQETPVPKSQQEVKRNETPRKVAITRDETPRKVVITQEETPKKVEITRDETPKKNSDTSYDILRKLLDNVNRNRETQETKMGETESKYDSDDEEKIPQLLEAEDHLLEKNSIYRTKKVSEDVEISNLD